MITINSYCQLPVIQTASRACPPRVPPTKTLVYQPHRHRTGDEVPLSSVFHTQSDRRDDDEVLWSRLLIARNVVGRQPPPQQQKRPVD